MALTVAVPTDVLPMQASVGQLRMTVRDVTFDTTYAAGGVALTAAQLGLNTVAFALCEVSGNASTASTRALVVKYDRVASKLQAFGFDGSQTGAIPFYENATANIATYTVRVMAFGS